MNNELIVIIVNLLYQEWLTTHSPFDEDFYSVLEDNLPDFTFSLDIRTNAWLLIS